MRAEYPNVRAFTLMPGIVLTDLVKPAPAFIPYAKDEAEMMGSVVLYLASERGEYLRGSLMSVNWDIPEMEAHKAEIEQGMLKTKWVPALPVNGGSGFLG